MMTSIPLTTATGERAGLVDINSRVPNIMFGFFVSTGAAVTVTGYFVNSKGTQEGLSFSRTIPAAGSTPIRMADSFDLDIVGAIIRIPATDIHFTYLDDDADRAAKLADFATNYSRFPTVLDNLPLSRVG